MNTIHLTTLTILYLISALRILGTCISIDYQRDGYPPNKKINNIVVECDTKQKKFQDIHGS